MRSFIKNSTISACFALLSLSLLCQPAFCRDDGKVSYLDGVSSSYLYNQSSDSGNGIEATFKLDTKPIITNSNKKVTMSLRDSDIQQALRMLADKAGINIIFDKSVEGKITLDLHDIDVNDAFLVIFKSRQLTYTMDANTLTVMTNDAYKETGYSRQNMTVLPIKYVSADSVAQFLNKNLFKSGITGLSNKPIVTSNPGTNQIVVFGSNADVMAIKRILPVLDVKPLINNFKVNHTTPKEMAQLICDSLFYKSGEEDGKKSSEKIDLEGDEVRLGGGVLVCRDSSNTQQSSDEDNLSAFRANPLSVSYFSELGQIGVYGGSQEQVNLIRDFIKMHDKKQLMAYIELSVIELNETGSKEFSNEWNLWTPFISLGFTPGGGLQTASTPFFVWGHEYPTNAEGSAFVRKVSNNNALTYKLKYLIDNGNGRVLTNPKIMVTNGKKSTIDMTSDYVKSVTSQVLQSSSSITSATQRTYDIGSDEGILIEIVPFISPDGYVSMNISPEFASKKGEITATNSQGEQELQATLLQRRDLDLRNIRIKDGETLVLAGLIRETESQTTKKMPILSDLPFIGAFFRASTSSKAREELVIVVTPHIIKDADAGIPQSTQNL